MKPQQLLEYLLNKPEAMEDYPFGDDVQVFKVRNKMFALLGVHEGQLRINLKCDPDEAIQLRDVFEAVIPGYHMNKRHWNTVVLDNSVPDCELERMIDNSYALVVKTLKKAERTTLELRYGREAIQGR